MSRLREAFFVEETADTDWLWALLVIGVLMLGGCAVGRTTVHQRPKSLPPIKKLRIGCLPSPMTKISAGIGGRFFQDPQLDSLELQVNVSNQNLKAAEAQYEESRAVLRYYRADYYPTVTAGLSGLERV